MTAAKREEFCSICGQPMPEHSPRKIYCSFECMTEGRRRKARVWSYKRNEERRIGRQIINESHRVGWQALAQSIVCTAIEDIRACSAGDILRYEHTSSQQPELGKQSRITRRMNYYDAEAFLLGDRIKELTEIEGIDIFKFLLKEKGLAYDGERVFIKV